MTLRARCLRVGAPWPLFALLCALLAGSTLLATSTAAAQSCPSGRYCFYVPPGLPLEGSHSSASSREFDIVISSPVRAVSGSYQTGDAAPTDFTVSPGNSVRVALGASGPASGYNVAERRGVFLVADSPDLTVDHRETFDQEQYSETIKRHEIALGTRFRLGGYSLNREGYPLAGVDAVLVYAPTGATISLSAPPGATLPFWSGSATSEYSLTLAAGQTAAVRTVVGRDIDGALLTATAPVAASSGGRGWSASVCGDDGMDGLVPVSALGTEHVVRLPTGSYTGNNESRVRVIADVDATEVRVNGTLVATLAAGAYHPFAPSALSYIQTSRPALVWMNGSIAGCELDTVLIPPIAFAPALTELSLDFNVPASEEVPAGELAMLIANEAVASIRLDGAAPTFISNESVPLRPDLSYVRFNISPGNRNVRARSDFQAMLASRTEPSGLLAYYNPYRIPGCGDGGIDPSEGCDDGGLADGDGCSSNCQVEPGYACSGVPSMCITTCGDGVVSPPTESCDDGNTLPGDGCNVTCRRELSITAPEEGSVSRAAMPVVRGSADVGASVSLTLGDVMTTVTADAAGLFEYTVPMPLPDGSYTLRAVATDVRGGVSMAMRTLTIDSGTTLTITEPTSSATLESNLPTVRGRGEPGASVTVRIDGVAVGSTTVAADGGWELTLSTPLASGPHELAADARDPLGNSASAAPQTITVDDNTWVTLVQPSEGERVDSATPELRGQGEPGASVRIEVDGVRIGSTTVDALGGFRMRLPTPLAEGAHRAVAVSTDALGNSAESAVTFTVETRREPMLFILNLPDGAYTRDPFPTFSGVADPGRHVQLVFDGVLIDTATSSARGGFSVRLLGPLTPGAHTLEASTVDAWGREASDRHTFIYEPDTALLTLTVPRENSVLSDATPTIAGTASAGARVQVLVDEAAIGETTALADGSWSLEVATPLAEGRHAARAIATDGATHPATVEVGFFVDTRSMVDILLPSEGRAGSATPTISGVAEPGVILTLEIDGVLVGELDVAGDGSWSFVVPTPLSPGPHRVRAEVLDALGNQAEDSAEFVVDLALGDGDGDGRLDAEECTSEPCRDTDGDGLSDAVDPDDDGDGLPTAIECTSEPCRDTDGDGLADYLDPDDDNDARPSSEERGSDGKPRDSDRDGVPDHLDADDDGDSIATLSECASAPCPDSDGDGTPDYLDFDDDNDRVPTVRERVDGMAAGDEDVDRDGLRNWLDADANQNGGDDGTDGTSDRDGDALPDYLDLDTPTPDAIVVSTLSDYAVAGGGGCSAGALPARGSASWLLLLIAFACHRFSSMRASHRRENHSPS